MAKVPRDLGPKRKTLMVLITDEDIKKALKVLREQMESGTPKDKIDCAKYLLDQRYGRPRQAVEMTGKDGEALFSSIKVEIVNAAGPQGN